jgi:hypothetical protein
MLTISVGRFRHIKADAEARRDAELAAEAARVEWDVLSHFSGVSDCLTLLDRVQPTPDRPVGRSGKP